MLQDRYGFIWIGTQVGLSMYDGTVFRPLEMTTGDGFRSSQLVFSLAEAHDGVLWIATSGGLARFNRQTEDFTFFFPAPGNINDPSNAIIDILTDHSGLLWLRTLDNFFSFDPGSQTFVNWSDTTHEGNLSSNQVTATFEDREGRLWIGTADAGLNLFDRTNNRFVAFRHDPLTPSSLSNDHISSITQDTSRNIWIGTFGGLNKLVDREHGVFKRFNRQSGTLPTDTLLVVRVDSSGIIWMGTRSAGLCKFDPRTGDAISYLPAPGNPGGSSNSVESIYLDRQGSLWLWRNSRSSGLSRFIPKGGTFTHYREEPGDRESLSDNWVLQLMEARNGQLWVLTHNGGLSIVHGTERRFERYVPEQGNLNSISHYGVTEFCEDQEGFVWIATAGGLNRFDPRSHNFTRFIHDPARANSISSNWLSCVCADRSGSLWIGTKEHGLNRFDPATHRFKNYTYDSTDLTSLRPGSVEAVYEDSRRTLWVGTTTGLDTMDRQTETFHHYDPVGAQDVRVLLEDSAGTLWIGGARPALRSLTDHSARMHPAANRIDVISAMAQHGETTLWLATSSSGLVELDVSNGTISQFTMAEGLPSDNIWGIAWDNQGLLWLGTEGGISRFDPGTSTFRNLGLWNGRGVYKASDGTIYIGGGGFYVFHPDRLTFNSYVPPVWITRLRVFDKLTRFEAPLMEMKVIELPHDQNSLAFDYVALNYVEAARNQYMYRLEGFDEEWKSAGIGRTANYTNLDPGEYVFRVRGSNNDDIWNMEGASLRLIIAPPWWQTWWAYALYILVTGTVLFGFRRYEMNRQALKHRAELEHIETEKLRDVDQMKSRFFANISHEFRTPLTLILGPAENITPDTSSDEIQRQTGIIKRNAGRLLGLVNQLLDLSKIEAGKLKLRASPGNIVPFVRGITMSFESVAERKDITLRVDAAVDDIQIYFDRDKMAKILTNLLSNAFKFTREGGEIVAGIRKREQDSVEIRVRDTGIGIPEDELPKLFDRFYQVDTSHTREYEGTGIGLSLTRELVELHKGQIRVASRPEDLSSGQAGWTEFTIVLASGRNHLGDDEIVEDRGTGEAVYATRADGAEESVAKREPVIRDGTALVLEQEDKSVLLVVEDNADVREYIIDSLGNDFALVEAVNGEQGIRKAIETIPDLIISDIMMPRMDGNELTRVLKSNEKTSHIPIILLTAKSEQESRLEGLETGADDYLIKPFDSKELQIRIRNLIAVRRKLQERFSRGGYAFGTKEKPVSNLEEQFMARVVGVIEHHIAEEEFSVEQLAAELFMSRMQLHRKLKALTGTSAGLYLRSFRLQRAKTMIIERQANMSEIAYAVGFSSPAYFARCFKEEFGTPPSEFQDR